MGIKGRDYPNSGLKPVGTNVKGHILNKATALRSHFNNFCWACDDTG